MVALTRLAEAWAAYQELHFAALSTRTQAEYTCCIRRALAELPGDLTLAAFVNWRNRLATAHGFGRAYVKLHVHTIHTVCDLAELTTGDRELRAMALALESLRCGEQWVQPPPDDFLSRTLAAARNLGERCWLLLAGLAGLRKSELLGLRPGDFDPAGNVLHVIRQRHEPHRKNRFQHDVRLVEPDLLRAMGWTIGHAEALRPRTGFFKGKSDGFLFPWAEKLLEGFLGRIRAHLGADAGRYLPRGCGWHHWRRWGATHLARRGGDVWKVLDWLGDRDPSMAAHYVDVGRGAADCLLLET